MNTLCWILRTEVDDAVSKELMNNYNRCKVLCKYCMRCVNAVEECVHVQLTACVGHVYIQVTVCMNRTD